MNTKDQVWDALSKEYIIKSTWDIEEEELIKQLSQELCDEIDEEVLQAMRKLL